MASDFSGKVNHQLYSPEQVARVAVEMAQEDAFLAGLISRNTGLGGSGNGLDGGAVNPKNLALSLKVPNALVAHGRGISDVDNKIVFDTLSDSTVTVNLGVHAYNAVALSEWDLNLNLSDFSGQVLAPQVESVVEYVESAVADTLAGIAYDTTVAWDASNPVPTFTAIRKVLRQRGVPVSGLVTVVGVNVYAALLDAKALDDVSQSGSTAALREGNVGKLRGFTIVESTRVDDDDIVAFHRDAFCLAVRAPAVPAGASFGKSVNGGGFPMRYLRDYSSDYTADRSIVSTFVGVAELPLYKVERTADLNTAGDVTPIQGSTGFVAGSATVSAVAAGAKFRMSISDEEPA